MDGIMERASEAQDLNPRNYQVELMNIALSQNTIIFLPTGSGKTFIAVMVLKKLGKALDKKYSNGGKLSIMAVNTVALVDQQSKYIQRHTHFDVGGYSGDMNVDSWDRGVWEAEFNKNQVLVMTAQILVNIVQCGFLSLSNINLLIFDECHHAVSDQPMRHFMKFFQSEPNPPRVIGLTATLLNHNLKPHKVLQELQVLETTYNSKIATVSEMEAVVGHSTNPQEFIKTYNPHRLSAAELEAIEHLDKLIDVLDELRLDDSGYKQKSILESKPNLKPLDKEKNCKDIINMLKDAKVHIEMLGIYSGWIIAQTCIIQLECIRRSCDSSKLFNALNVVILTFSKIVKIFRLHMSSVPEKEQVFKFSSPKVRVLLEVLKMFKDISEEELCAIVFVQRRFTAKILYHILKVAKESDKGLECIEPDFIVGNSCNPFSETREGPFKTKLNRKTLNKFCLKQTNLLVATNVIEEGVDIPMCSLIVKFDEPQDYRSYVQSKGRARHKASKYFILLNEDNYDNYFAKHLEFQDVEGCLIQYLVGKSDQRDDITEEQLQDMYNEELLPPYCVNGAKVDMLSAIPLLSMYCNSLPSDKFTSYNPEWYLEKIETVQFMKPVTMYKVFIELPVVCPILEPIEGIFLRNKKLAKRASALKGCIALHKAGELSDDLLPIKRNIPDPSTNFLFTHWPDAKEKDTGMKRRVRSYPKKIAECLKGDIEPGKKVYLHILEFNPCFENSNKNQSFLYDLLSSNLSYGIISANPLLEICDFPVYISAGCITVSVKVNKKVLSPTKEQLDSMRSFHSIVFDDILNIVKPFLMLHTKSEQEMLLVVPVKKDVTTIDFDTIAENPIIFDRKAEPKSDDRFNLVVNNDTHLGKIVTPWYRNDEVQYIVTEVCHNMNAKSPFATDEFKTYADYFKEKYNCTILNPDLPLLLVKRIFTKLNCLKPRGSKGKRDKEKLQEGLEEHLLPELCVKQSFPGGLWFQANLLPTILYRITNLMKAEELRRQIVKESRLGVLNFPNWKPLEFDEFIGSTEETIPKKSTDINQDVNDFSNMFETLTTLTTSHCKTDFDTRVLELQYPWKDEEEPVDLDRNLDVNLLDIQYYVKFTSQKVTHDELVMKHSSPRHNEILALTYDEEYQYKPIELLLPKLDKRGPELTEIYRALTAQHCNDIVNFERLETLGDSFLKFVSSLYIVLTFPNYDEGKSTTLKSKLVSNKNLYYLADQKKIGSVLLYSEFQPQVEWCPSGYCVPKVLRDRILENKLPSSLLYMFYIPPEERKSGILSEETKQSLAEDYQNDLEEEEERSRVSTCHFIGNHFVPDKIVADVVEALLGAYFKSCGLEGGLKFFEWLGLIPESEKICDILKQEVPNPILNANCTQAKIDFHIPSWEKIEEKLGYHFNNRAYLLQALTHASYTPNRLTHCYQKLEFLGDAVLDFLITCYIYESCGDLSPGELTDLRSALVNNVTFACFTVRCGFYKFMLSMNSKLEATIDKFVDYQEKKSNEIDDDIIILLNENDLHLGESVDVPKALGDIFEALAGAVFLDSGMNLNTVWQVFYKIIWRELKSFSANVPKNAIRLLHETPSAHPVFHKAEELDNGKVMVKLEFLLKGDKKIVHGFGDNNKVAKKAAAKLALRLLN